MALVLIAHSVLSTYTHTSHFCRNLLASPHFSFSEAPQSPQLEAEFLCGSPHSLKPNHGVWCWLPLTHFLPFLGAQWCYPAVEPPQASQTHRLFVFGALTTPNPALLLAQGLLKQSKSPLALDSSRVLKFSWTIPQIKLGERKVCGLWTQNSSPLSSVCLPLTKLVTWPSLPAPCLRCPICTMELEEPVSLGWKHYIKCEAHTWEIMSAGGSVVQWLGMMCGINSWLCRVTSCWLEASLGLLTRGGRG